jgi:hypothetical protein
MDVMDEQFNIIETNNLNMGVISSLNWTAGGIGLDSPLGVTARFDLDGAGGSSTTGWVRGSLDPFEATQITTLTDSVLCTLANPAWTQKYCERSAADSRIPAALIWMHVSAGTPADEFISYYQRSDFQTAFAAGITAGASRSSFDGWRTAK